MVILEDQKQFWFSITKPTNREARLVRKKVINKYSSLVWLIRLSDPLQPTVPLVCTIKQGSSEIKLAHSKWKEWNSGDSDVFNYIEV